MAYQKILGYGPDLDPTTPGLIIDGDGVVPTVKGMEGIPSAANESVPELSATATGAISIQKTDGSVRTIAGTPTKMYEISTTSWADITRAAGDYTAGSTWRFAQFGDQTLATNDSSVVQASVSGAFADLTGGPVAKIIEVVNNQVFAFNTNEATFGDSPDRWWTSALGDSGDWTPSIASQSASARLTATPGEITAGRRLGDEIVAYKEQSIYLGRYFGPPEIWGFRLISDRIGAVSQEAVVPVDTDHVFMGIDDFYTFNGAVARAIGGPIKTTFFEDELDPDNRDKTQGILDRDHSRIYFFYPSRQGDGSLDRVISYNYRVDKWGPCFGLPIRSGFEYTRTTGLTYDALGTAYTTYDDIPATPYDSKFWSGTKTTLVGIINTSDQLQTLSGEHTSSDICLWHIGDDQSFIFLNRTRPRFAKQPTSATQHNSYAENLDDAAGFTSDSPSSTLTNGKFDFERSARWHKLRWTITGDYELLGVDIQGEEDGSE